MLCILKSVKILSASWDIKVDQFLYYLIKISKSCYLLTLPCLSCQFPDSILPSKSFLQVSNSWLPGIIPLHPFLSHHYIHCLPLGDLQWNDPRPFSPSTTTHRHFLLHLLPSLPDSFPASLLKLLNILGESSVIRLNDFCCFCLFREVRWKVFVFCFCSVFQWGWELQVLLSFREGWWFLSDPNDTDV